ncbi:MAG: DegT/DnrJ/EryC1/StrS family aminotransferase [Candidatus Kryptonium sp.]
MEVPIFTPVRQYMNLKEEIDSAIQKVLSKGSFILGDEVSEFENKVAQYLGVKHAIGVASGTDALQIALMAIGLKPGEEVITTPFTFVATAETIVLLGGKPVYVDIDEKTYNINPDLIEEKITEKTKAIIPVHLYGQPAEMDKILDIARRYNLYVIEDSAQALGSEYKGKKVCTFGDIACISFFPTKNLGAFGDAGMIVTNNDELAERIRMIRVHGSKVRYNHEILGVNSRLDTLQASILLVKLKYLDSWNAKRIEIAEKYNDAFKDIDDVVIPYSEVHNKHIYHQYTIRTRRRDELAQFLKEKGIQTAVHYPIPLHLQKAFAYLGYKQGDFPISEQCSREVLSLPMFPELRDEEINYVIESVKEFFKR